MALKSFESDEVSGPQSQIQSVGRTTCRASERNCCVIVEGCLSERPTVWPVRRTTPCRRWGLGCRGYLITLQDLVWDKRVAMTDLPGSLSPGTVLRKRYSK
jgi:hypothetical protein